MNHLQEYLDDLKEEHGKGEYGRKLQALSVKIDILPLQIYRAARGDADLPVAQACRLEVATNGKVPATSTCDKVEDTIEAVNDLMSFRWKAARKCEA